MTKVLLIVPKMFTRGELSRIDPDVPTDYEEKSNEFWKYVTDRLHTLPFVNKIYYDSLTEDVNDPIEFVRGDNDNCYSIVSDLLKNNEGARLEITEDKISVSEARAWAEMVEKGDRSVLDLLNQTIEERNSKVAGRISSRFSEGETAVFFVNPSRKLSSYFEGSGIRAITIQPFDPVDYVNSWLATLQIRRRGRTTTTKP